MSLRSLRSLQRPLWLVPHDSALMLCTCPSAYIHQALHCEVLLPSSKAQQKLMGYAPVQGALAELGLPRSKAYLHDIIKQYDVNGDGSIDW